MALCREIITEEITYYYSVTKWEKYLHYLQKENLCQKVSLTMTDVWKMVKDYSRQQLKSKLIAN